MKKIIVQETDQHVLDVLTQALQLEDYHVYALQQTDKDFMALIEQTRPHVVMLDYKLSGEKCLEIFMNIKKKYPHLPLIALSCNHNINTIAMEVGFDDYIPKPFDLDHLYITLRKYIPNPAQATSPFSPTHQPKASIADRKDPFSPSNPPSHSVGRQKSFH